LTEFRDFPRLPAPGFHAELPPRKISVGQLPEPMRFDRFATLRQDVLKRPESRSSLRYQIRVKT